MAAQEAAHTSSSTSRRTYRRSQGIAIARRRAHGLPRALQASALRRVGRGKNTLERWEGGCAFVAPVRRRDSSPIGRGSSAGDALHLHCADATATGQRGARLGNFFLLRIAILQPVRCKAGNVLRVVGAYPVAGAARAWESHAAGWDRFHTPGGREAPFRVVGVAEVHRGDGGPQLVPPPPPRPSVLRCSRLGSS